MAQWRINYGRSVKFVQHVSWLSNPIDRKYAKYVGDPIDIISGITSPSADKFVHAQQISMDMELHVTFVYKIMLSEDGVRKYIILNYFRKPS